MAYPISFLNLKSDRELGSISAGTFQRLNHFSRYLVDKIALSKELKGHSGCVNCLEWDQTGRILWSGSDDTMINAWDMNKKEPVAKLTTPHTGNIFSVKRIPGYGCDRLVTGSADSTVCMVYTDTVHSAQRLYTHKGRVKQLATSLHEPMSSWSCSEDGTVRHYDFREMKSSLLLDLHGYDSHTPVGKSLAVNPTKSELMAVGSSGPYVRVYDRRFIQSELLDLDPGAEDPGDPWNFLELRSRVPVDYESIYVPGHLPALNRKSTRRLTAVTGLCFSPDGKHLVANYASEHMYSFDITSDGRVHTEFEIPCLEQFWNNREDDSKEYAADSDVNKFADRVMSQIRPYHCSRHHVHQSEFDRTMAAANQYFDRGHYFHAIQLYNSAVSLRPNTSMPRCNRAAALLKREWRGDYYAALRDCLVALAIERHKNIGADNNDDDYGRRAFAEVSNCQIKAHFRLVKSLYHLKRYDEASNAMASFQLLYPKVARSRTCEKLNCDLLAVRTDATCKDQFPAADNPALDMDVRHGFDYCKQFIGQCNCTTDIKSPAFMGSGDFLAVGSDDGNFFIFDYRTQNVVRIMKADSCILNCIQPNPCDCKIATSGIEDVIKIWEPIGFDAVCSSQTDLTRLQSDHMTTSAANQRRMDIDPADFLLSQTIFGGGWPFQFEDDSGQLSEATMFQCNQS